MDVLPNMASAEVISGPGVGRLEVLKELNGRVQNDILSTLSLEESKYWSGTEDCASRSYLTDGMA